MSSKGRTMVDSWASQSCVDRQLARAGGRDLMLNDVLLPRAREAREAPGGGRGERARQDEAARHIVIRVLGGCGGDSGCSCSGGYASLFAQAAATWDFQRPHSCVCASYSTDANAQRRGVHCTQGSTAFDSPLAYSRRIAFIQLLPDNKAGRDRLTKFNHARPPSTTVLVRPAYYRLRRPRLAA